MQTPSSQAPQPPLSAHTSRPDSTVAKVAAGLWTSDSYFHPPGPKRSGRPTWMEWMEPAIVSTEAEAPRARHSRTRPEPAHFSDLGAAVRPDPVAHPPLTRSPPVAGLSLLAPQLLNRRATNRPQIDTRCRQAWSLMRLSATADLLVINRTSDVACSINNAGALWP